MFTTSVARAARCSAYSCPHSPAPARRIYQAALSSKHTCTQPNQPSRQRRHSSSKASAPPSDGTSAAPASTRSESAATVSREITATRGRGKKTKLVTVNRSGRLPMVPTTQHLHPNFINLSSFFSLHRPISVDQRLVLPPVVTDSQFARIFESKSPRRQSETGIFDVLQTLEAAVIDFDGGNETSHHQDIMNFSRANTSENDSVLKIFDEHRPFVPPPVPQSTARRGRRSVREAGGNRSRQWSTTIVLTEHTLPSGEKSYSASGSPLERMPSSSIAPTSSIPAVVMQEPEAVEISMVEIEEPNTPGRVRWRRNGENNHHTINAPMVALSVKRQRYAKMKKKKFKKLMKRTRNLRRKLGKL